MITKNASQKNIQRSTEQIYDTSFAHCFVLRRHGSSLHGKKQNLHENAEYDFFRDKMGRSYNQNSTHKC